MSYRDNPLFRALKNRRSFKAWKAREFAAPSPDAIKQAVFRRHNISGATWIETGTFMGDTTRFLSSIAPQVISIEPAEKLYRKAVKRFQGRDGIRIVNDTSENAFPALLADLEGDLCFWLDGHYSAGSTFQGQQDTPILQELEAIEQALPRLGKVAILIDDIRCFDPSQPDYDTYPKLDVLIDWARKLGLKWHIEHDILIVTNS